MTRRQTVPEQWLILDRPPDGSIWAGLRRLPRGNGVLVLPHLDTAAQRRLRNLAALRNLTLVTEDRGAARVHDVRELRRALLSRRRLLFLSPLYPTRSHPDWRPLPRMRAASLASLADRRLVALGGMNARRYAKIAPLGFIGWAGISAFRT